MQAFPKNLYILIEDDEEDDIENVTFLPYIELEDASRLEEAGKKIAKYELVTIGEVKTSVVFPKETKK